MSTDIIYSISTKVCDVDIHLIQKKVQIASVQLQSYSLFPRPPNNNIEHDLHSKDASKVFTHHRIFIKNKPAYSEELDTDS